MHPHPLIEFLDKSNRILAPDSGKESWNIGGIDERTWRAWRNGERPPKIKSLKRVANALWTLLQPTHPKREQIVAGLQAMDPAGPASLGKKESFVEYFEDVSLRLSAMIKLTVKIRRPGDSDFMAVEQPGIAPVPFKSDVRVDVKASHPVYLHVLWIDSAGGATPLHPWEPGAWSEIKAQRRTNDLSLPKDRPAWQIDTDAGTETVVVVSSIFEVTAVELGSLRDQLMGLPARSGKVTGPAVVHFAGKGGMETEARLSLTPEVPEKEWLAWRHQELQARLRRFARIEGFSFANAGKKMKGKL